MDLALPDAESKAILVGGPAAFVTPATSTGCARAGHGPRRQNRCSAWMNFAARSPMTTRAAIVLAASIIPSITARRCPCADRR